MTITMAISTASTSSLLLHSSSSSSTSISGKPYSLSTHSSYAISIPKNAKVGIPHLGFTPFPQWNGLKSFGFSISHSPAKMKKEEGRSRGRGVFASLFGVGAPEALVIGVVALLVFGPKGLAEVARNLGKTLRAFQPTIRELQEVSRDFKSTLEREIGLDDIDNPVPKSSSSSAVKPTPETSETKAEPNGSLTENEEVKPDPYAKVSAPQLLGALAQLQKEQAEEREREEKEREEKEKEKEEKDNTQLQLETATPSPPDTEAKDTPQEAASPVMPPSQSPESNLLQGATSVPGPINESEM